ncbi:MAG: prolyl oligopeptidase family serine peptidase [Flavobacteriales bacterium]|nr:prolyl oligopeptidase family serine peptidase [Flavobacteriales bacterium]
MSRSLITLFLVAASTIAHAQVSSTISHNGITRDHITYVPTGYTQGTPTPLVFVMHGFTQSASAIMNATDFNALAELEGFIVAYPNGVDNGWNTNSPFPGGSTADDVGYIGALCDTLIAAFSIDTTRIYACGFSAGGYMSHKLGCESPKCFAAIASVSGTINTGDVGECAPQHTPGVLQIHGTSEGDSPGKALGTHVPVQRRSPDHGRARFERPKGTRMGGVLLSRATVRRRAERPHQALASLAEKDQQSTRVRWCALIKVAKATDRRSAAAGGQQS